MFETVRLGGVGSEDLDTFQVEVYPEWAPIGAARFLELVDTVEPEPFFDSMKVFRMLSGFVAQFGINKDPQVADFWRDLSIEDDPVLETNAKGTMTFAMRGPNTRTTQVFINLDNNGGLDGQGFAPFAKVVDGFDVVESFYAGYGEGAPNGNGPDQFRIQTEGNAYLEANFPLLSEIVSVKRVAADATTAPTPDPSPPAPAVDDGTPAPTTTGQPVVSSGTFASLSMGHVAALLSLLVAHLLL